MKQLDKDILGLKIEKRINEDVTEGKVAGAAVHVVQDGEILYRNFFGFSDVEKQTKLNEQNLFRMASMTKPVTAACILILEEKGLLKVTDKVSKYIPGFENMYVGSSDGETICAGEKAEKEITIEMLLSHKSGLGSGAISDKLMSEMTQTDRYSLETVVNYYKNMLLDFQPGRREFYSGIAGFDVLARIVEIQSGKSFSEFAEENIFKPLQMNNTTFTPNEEQWKKIVKMSNYTDGKAVNAPMPKSIFANFPKTYTCGGAGLVSSLDDYAKFAQMLLLNGTNGKVRVLSEESINKLHTPNLPDDLTKGYEVWGFGVRVNKNMRYSRLEEGAYGWSGAYGTHFFVDIENKITAVYMKNSWFDGGSGAITAANFEEDVYSALK